MISYTCKEDRGFDDKFAFDNFVILKTPLSNKLFNVDMILIKFQHGMLYKGFSIVGNGLYFYNEGSVEEHVAPKKCTWVGLTAVKMVDFIAYVVFPRPSSTRCTMSCSGCCECAKKIVFSTSAMV